MVRPFLTDMLLYCRFRSSTQSMIVLMALVILTLRVASYEMEPKGYDESGSSSNGITGRPKPQHNSNDREEVDEESSDDRDDSDASSSVSDPWVLKDSRKPRRKKGNKNVSNSNASNKKAREEKKSGDDDDGNDGSDESSSVSDPWVLKETEKGKRRR